MAITFKGAYLSEENLQDLAAAFAAANRAIRDPHYMANRAVIDTQQKLLAISSETCFHYA